MKKQRLIRLAILLLLALPTVVWGSNWQGSSLSWTTGTGTADDPIRINSGENLAYLAQMVNAGNSFTGKYFVLTTDINLGAAQWTPIGEDGTKPFSGNFDGQGHTISYLSLVDANRDYGGLFGYLQHADIRRVRLANVYVFHSVSMLNNSTNDVYWGALAGYAQNSNIEMCQVNTGNISGNGSFQDMYVGALVGYTDYTDFTDCVNTAWVDATSYTLSCAGGITGKSGHGEMTRCTNHGDISANTSGQLGTSGYYAYTGGLSGQFHSMSVSMCSNNNTVYAHAASNNGTSEEINNRGTARSGGLVGHTTSDGPENENTFVGCFNNGPVQTNTSNNGPSFTGGLSGEDGAFENCYNAGQLSGLNPNAVIGGLCAGLCTGIEDPATGTTPDNNYYIDTPNINHPGCGTPTDSAYMLAPEFPGILNNGGDSVFVADSNGYFNGGFPIFTRVPYIKTLAPLAILSDSIDMSGYFSADHAGLVVDSIGFEIAAGTTRPFDWERFLSSDSTLTFDAWSDSLNGNSPYTYRAIIWVNGMPYYAEPLQAMTLDCRNSHYYTNNYTTTTKCDQYSCEGRTFYSDTTCFVLHGNDFHCNDTAFLALTIQHRDTVADPHTVCDTYTWMNGETYTRDTTLYYTIPEGNTANGCDRDMLLQLTVNYSDTINQTISGVCDTYTWTEGNGQTYTHSATATHHTTNPNNCPRTMNLDLTVLHRDTVADPHTACDSYTWINGQTYTQNATAYHTIANGNTANGCDRDMYLQLTVNYSDDTTHTVSACDSYTWTEGDGQTYTADSQVAFNTTNRFNCPRTMNLDLTIRHSSQSTHDTNVCDYYYWRENSRFYIADNTTDYVVLQGANNENCDSTIFLSLAIHQSHTGANAFVDDYTTADKSVCGSLTWHGITYTQSTDNTPNPPIFHAVDQWGCAQDTVLRLVVRDENIVPDTLVLGNDANNPICDYYDFDGRRLQETGSYTWVTTDPVSQCDITNVLQITIKHSSTSSEQAVACDSYSWHGNTYSTTPGNNQTINTYFDTLNADRCNHRINLALQLNAHTRGVDYVQACDHYTWRDGVMRRNSINHTISSVTDTLSHANTVGCDSVLFLDLTINPSSWRLDPAVPNTPVCDAYDWNGITYTHSIDTSMHVIKISQNPTTQCFDTLALAVTIVPSKTTQIDTTVCDMMVNPWTNLPIRATGTYRNPVSLYTATGHCDSTVYLNLIVNHSVASSESTEACDYYTWQNGRNKSYTFPAGSSATSHTVTDTVVYKTHGAQCDSTVTLTLTLHPSYAQNLPPASAACDSYTWLDQTYTTTGTYTNTLNTMYGCDSVLTMDITVFHSTNETLTVDAATQSNCDGYQWNGQTYTQPGSYPAIYPASNGVCDSTVTLNLTGTMRMSANTSFDAVACDLYVWEGTSYSQSGDYTRVLTRSSADNMGCDSTVTMRLTVNPSYHQNLPPASAACDSYTWMDRVYTVSGTYTNTLNTMYGCDSVLTMDITVFHSTNETLTVDATTQSNCDGYQWNGQTYTQPGTYTAIYPASNGVCDSTVTLNLTGTMRMSANTSFDAVACDFYEWEGSSYNQSGDYTRVLTRTGVNEGCDSTVTLRLIVNNSYANSESQEACDQYVWHGQTLTGNGTYEVHYNTVAGCDSSFTLNLTVNHGSAITDRHVACDHYTWIDGMTYNVSTSPSFQPSVTLTGANGCDSVITLSLAIHPSYEYTINEDVCDTYTWGGRVLTQTGNYSDSLKTAHNCDSIIHLNLIVRYSPHTYFDTFTDYSYNPVFWPETIGQWWDATGEYDWVYVAENGCDSISTMNLTVMGKDLPRIISYGNNIIALDHYPHSQNAQGNRVDFAHKRWYHDGKHIEGADDYDYIAKQDFGIMYGTFWCEVTDGTPTSNNWVPSNVIAFTDDSLAVSLGQPQVSPNPAKSGSQVNITLNLTEEQLDGAIVRIYDLQGRLVKSYEPKQAESIFQNDLCEGVYTVSVTTKQGNRATTRLIVK